MRHLNIGHFTRHGYQVIGHIAVEHLAVFVVKAFFKQRATYALHNGAAYLLIYKHRVDDSSAIFNSPVLEKFDKSGVGVHLYIGGLHTIGEDERKVLLRKMTGHHEFWRKSSG